MRRATLVTLLLAACSPTSERLSDTEAGWVSLPEALGGAEASAGYARADAPLKLDFPSDHGPHPDYRVEWWYLTGHLVSDAGERYGYQFTLFRTAVAPESEAITGRSAWSTRQLYLAHLGLTDVEGERFFSAERRARGAVGLAGVESQPFAAWLDDWSLRAVDPSGIFPARLTAKEGEIELDLTLDPGKPIVLHGDRGWSRKSGSAGTASYYYSFTRLPTRGTIRTPRTGDATVPVEGESWMDREWTTSVLSGEHLGWDWFSLQLDDGHELMLFRLRRRDGTPDPFLGGTLVRPDGSYRTVDSSVFVIEARSSRSSSGGGRYPTSWRITSDELDWHLEIDAALEDQEHRLSVSYWEGAVYVTGRTGSQNANGIGFVEMTGYESRHAAP